MEPLDVTQGFVSYCFDTLSIMVVTILVFLELNLDEKVELRWIGVATPLCRLGLDENYIYLIN